MKYIRYGISFHLLKEADIELVRQWRNDPVVAGNFEFRGKITPEMQKAWYSSVCNIHNLYTIIEYQGDKIGVVNVKNIDWDARVCEGGIFIPHPAYHQTFVPAIISYITTEFFFVILQWDICYARVLKENKKVQAYVKMLGYRLMPGQETVNNQQYIITRASFEKKAWKIKKAISILAGMEEKGVLHIASSEFNDPQVLQWEEKFKTSPVIAKAETTEEGRFYYFS
jgi:UDP-4-amino-4,6-dideoxy-N-acetyl-beta-L-altrosamine N-acetyltransferase